jgi:dolichyl-phosphate beta-glucosyltransferase
LIIDRLIAAFPNKRMHKLFHEKNTGRGKAVCDGFRMAEGKVVGYVDIDLEVGENYIPVYTMKVLQGADVVLAKRIYRFYPRALIRYVTTIGYRVLVRWMLRLPYSDTECGYKFFSKQALGRLLPVATEPGWFWDTEVMAESHRLGLRVEEVPSLYLHDWDKRSTVQPLKDSWDYFWKLLEYKRRRA